MEAPGLERVHSYGYTRSVSAHVARPRDLEALRDCLDFARSRGLSLVPAGGRNSFGDVFLLREQLVVDMTGMARIESFDAERGLLVAEAGARIPDILARIMPEGWFLCGLSGSLWNTVGGNLGSNIHGKDSWRDGNFAENVVSFRLLRADGEEMEVTRESDPELFVGVPGGLGLLGIVTQVTLALRRIPSVQVRTRRARLANFGALAERFAQLDPEETDFAYSRVDPFARGAEAGRSVFETARFAAGADPASLTSFREGLTPPRRVAFLAPESFWALYRAGWDALVALRSEGHFQRALNALHYRTARDGDGSPGGVPFPAFQYPMVKHFSHWQDRFRPHGFHEIQSLFPFETAVPAFRAVLEACRASRIVPEICAVRRHRDDATLLSLSGDGLSMTFSYGLKHLDAARVNVFTQRLMDTILEHRGRIYLAKFPYLSHETFERMFPEHTRFRALKERLDPERRFWSDAAERLLGRGRA